MEKQKTSDWDTEKNSALDIYFKPIHSMNRIITPTVSYESWKEFVDLVYWSQNAFCNLVQESVENEMTATNRENAYFSVGSLALVQMHTQGPSILMKITKETGSFWCSMVSNFICARVLRAAFIYESVIQYGVIKNTHINKGHTGNVLDLIQIMQQEIFNVFAGAMPFSIYSFSSGFISTLLVQNFTFYKDVDLTAFSHSQFENMLLTLAMGLHPRLGVHSPLLLIDSEILHALCNTICSSYFEKHRVFHTQEQWLF